MSFEGVVFQIPKNSPFRSHAGKRIDVHVLFDGTVEFFFKNKESPASISKTAHAFGLYRTNAEKRERFRYGPLSRLQINP